MIAMGHHTYPLIQMSCIRCSLLDAMIFTEPSNWKKIFPQLAIWFLTVGIGIFPFRPKADQGPRSWFEELLCRNSFRRLNGCYAQPRKQHTDNRNGRICRRTKWSGIPDKTQRLPPLHGEWWCVVKLFYKKPGSAESTKSFLVVFLWCVAFASGVISRGSQGAEPPLLKLLFILEGLSHPKNSCSDFAFPSVVTLLPKCFVLQRKIVHCHMVIKTCLIVDYTITVLD